MRNKLRRTEFIREYYTITDNQFADAIIWSAKDWEEAWKKRKHATSRSARRAFIAAQYIVLFSAVLLLHIGYGAYSLGCLAMFLLLHLITDFSFIKMELLYQIFRRNNPYSMLLYQAFRGEQGEFWRSLKQCAPKHVSGFARKTFGKFVVKYRVVYRKKCSPVEIELDPFGITVKTKPSRHSFREPDLSIPDLIEGIAAILNAPE